MTEGSTGRWERLILDGAGRRWARIARNAGTAELKSLEAVQHRARRLARDLDTVQAVARSRLALPRIGSSAFPLPVGTDWSWRPDLWRWPLATFGRAGMADGTRINDQTLVFHDCRLAEITLRQIRNTDPSDLAPFAAALDVLDFTGSFLSLAVDLPPEGVRDLRKRHIFRAEAHAVTERPTALYARLNIRHGPNTEKIVRDILPDQPVVEFDLAYCDIDEKRVSGAWIDLIADRPAFNRIVWTDVTIARYPRGEF